MKISILSYCIGTISIIIKISIFDKPLSLCPQLADRLTQLATCPPVQASQIWPKVDQIGLKSDKSATFSEQISVHFGSVSQNVLKSDMKNPGFVPFGANLTHFGFC